MTSPTSVQPREGLWGARLLVFDSLPSTNTWVMENAAQCRHGDVVLAHTQTQGRGRFERPWLAVPGKSLAMSVFLDPTRFNDERLHALGPCTALAVRRMLGRRHMPATVKWPNDVMVNTRKISGILLEQSPQAIVLGIGINLALTRHDLAMATLQATATSVLIETGSSPTAAAFCQAFVATLSDYLQEASESNSLMRTWIRYDSLIGKRITVTTVAGAIQGRYDGLSPDWRLRLLDRAGQVHILSAGDVTLRA